jgi:predicted RNA-binding Zn-ribbon protein involved in translation (DUF1610 family)
MVKRSAPLEAGETVCPSCGAGIKAIPSAKRRRVQCPKCREVVVLESDSRKEIETDLPLSPKPDTTNPANTEARERIDLLESRVELLEAALAGAMAAAHTANLPSIQRKLMWITTGTGQSPAYSSEQDRALTYNLAGVRSQTIQIRTPAGDPDARAHAEWFKAIFERAGWIVEGPEEILPHTPISGLTLAIPDLPVSKDTAETYLAMKAAGFETNAILDPTPRDETNRTTLALTLPSGRAV